ncbi:MAG: methyltransferase domain-containing protein [Sedimenticola sp.]
MTKERNVEEFNKDTLEGGGYKYTSDKLSCSFANRRISNSVFGMTDFKGKRVLDVGCGDGTYTLELISRGATEVLGIDAAEDAVRLASERALGLGLDNVSFKVADIYSLHENLGRYDIAVVRGILHHLYNVQDAISNIVNVADEIIVVEPNGFNPVLKIIEKLSLYHRAHEEKSYSPSSLDAWFEQFGGKVLESEYIGLVPMFCPDWFARKLKSVEPAFESIPLIRNICCGQYVQKVSTRTDEGN